MKLDSDKFMPIILEVSKKIEELKKKHFLIFPLYFSGLWFSELDVKYIKNNLKQHGFGCSQTIAYDGTYYNFNIIVRYKR